MSLTCYPSAVSFQVTSETGIRSLVPAADIDDYVFEPCGYSMNGILGSGFITIHITPGQYEVQQCGATWTAVAIVGFLQFCCWVDAAWTAQHTLDSVRGLFCGLC